MKFKTLQEISQCQPVFKFGYFTMAEWFNVDSHGAYCSITSGLKHADGETKSPFFYSKVFFGENCTFNAIDNFNEWFFETLENIDEEDKSENIKLLKNEWLNDEKWNSLEGELLPKFSNKSTVRGIIRYLKENYDFPKPLFK